MRPIFRSDRRIARSRQQSGRGAPGDDWTPLSGAAVHLDFTRQRYYWNGAERLAANFTTFTGGTFSSGLVLDGVAVNFDISVSLATANISLPCVLIVSYTPGSVTGTQYIGSIDTDVNNVCSIGLSGSSKLAFVNTAGVTQASVATAANASIGTRITCGANFETNNILLSDGGVTAGTPDTLATLPSLTTIRIGERSGGAPFTGTVHHIVIVGGAQTQGNLNTFTAAVAGLPI